MHIIANYDCEAFSPAVIIRPHTWIQDPYEQTPEQASLYVRDQFQNRDVKDKAIFIWRLLDGTYPRNPLDAITKGIDYTAHLSWMTEFWNRLAQLGVIPSLIVLDDEGNMSTWAILQGWGEERGLNMVPVYEHPNCPNEIKHLTPSDFNIATTDPLGGDASWNRWADAQKQKVHKMLVVDSVRAAYGKTIPHLNYGEFRSLIPMTDFNGHMLNQDISLAGDINSPVIYNWGIGGKFHSLQKHIRWNSLIDGLNVIRACLDHSSSCVPWISNPVWSGDHIDWSQMSLRDKGAARWWWTQVMIHMTINGVNNFVYWNIGPTEEDRCAKSIVDTLGKMSTPRLRLPQIPLDSDEIVTGTYRTTYDEFLGQYL